MSDTPDPNTSAPDETPEPDKVNIVADTANINTGKFGDKHPDDAVDDENDAKKDTKKG